jgi:hypothetical protein
MKKTQIVGLVIVVVFVIGVVTVSAASALEYLVSGVAVKPGEKVAVSLSGALILEDMGKGSPTTIECASTTGTGVVEAGGEGEQSSATPTGCVTLAGTCSSPLVRPIHLPWLTQILGEGYLFSSSGAGTPGYEVTCFGIIHDTCTGKIEAGLENMPSEAPPDLLAIFSSIAPISCTLGGPSEGLMVGEVLVTTTGGELSLAIS